MIHQYKLGGLNIVIDVNSGAVHVVDEVAYDIIAMYENTSADQIVAEMLEKYSHLPDVDEGEIRECIADIEALKAAGKLFSQDNFSRLAGKMKQGNIIKAICLHVAHACNLRCEYCFAAQGEYHGEKALMSYETGKQALEFLIANSGSRHNLEVDFFGGEPLVNWEVCKQLVEYARKREKEVNKNFRFTMTTNGVLLTDEVTEYLNKEMHNVVLSLDGRKEVNDRFRVDAAGVGSYDRIVPNFQRFVQQRGDKEYYMRGTYTHHNTDFTEDIQHMLDLGFDQLSMEPVVTDPADPCALTQEDLPVLFEQYEKLAEMMIQRRKAGKPFTFYHYMVDLTAGPCIYKRLSGCGSGTEYMAVTPNGDLYPCHQFVGKEDFKLGDIWNGVQKPEVQDQFRSCNVYSHPECADCWARLYCAGGCAANAYNSTGSVNGVYEYGCELFKKRMECAIMVECVKNLEQ